MKILKICLSRLVENGFQEAFLYTSCKASLPSFLLYQVSSFCANIIANVELVLFQNFLVRLGENFLKFYLLLIGLFFLDGNDKKKLTAVHPPNNYPELKLIVLNHTYKHGLL